MNDKIYLVVPMFNPENVKGEGNLVSIKLDQIEAFWEERKETLSNKVRVLCSRIVTISGNQYLVVYSYSELLQLVSNLK